MSPSVTANPDESPHYWRDLAVEQLKAQGVLPPLVGANTSEILLWGRLVTLHAASLSVLSDVDDDGIAEAQDTAILGLREALNPPATKRSTQRSRAIGVASQMRRSIVTNTSPTKLRLKVTIRIPKFPTQDSSGMPWVLAEDVDDSSLAVAMFGPDTPQSRADAEHMVSLWNAAL